MTSAVLGVTGLTGNNVAEYLARNAPKSLKWAIAGRNLSRLESASRNIATIRPEFSNIGILVCDVESKDSIEEVVSKTKVLVTTVGPYVKYGTVIVDACVRLQTDYVDITGETIWVREMIEKYHAKAAASGTLIIPMCGFESMPADIGVFAVVQYIRSNFNRETAYVKGTVDSFKGGVSGGTLASADAMFNNLIYVIWGAFDVNFLVPGSMKFQLPFFFPFWYDWDFKKWQGYFLPFQANMMVVYRSHALLKNYYGPSSFSYYESMSNSNILGAIVFTWALLVTMGMFLIYPIRKAIMFFAPKPGEGPSREEIRKGHYTYKFVGEPVRSSSSSERVRVEATVHGNSCPGYGETALMIAEAGLCLALNRDKIPGRGGLMTPASALGDVLISRLREAGVQISVSRK